MQTLKWSTGHWEGDAIQDVSDLFINGEIYKMLCIKENVELGINYWTDSY